jgi:predicted nucleotidyltransferase
MLDRHQLHMIYICKNNESKKIMVPIQKIEEWGRKIGQEFHPERVFLFGSHAYGTPTPDSDVDILVIMQHEGKGWRRASEIRIRVKPTFPVDLLVRTPEEIHARLSLGDCFIKEIVEKGRVLYENDDQGMDSES